MNLNDVIVFPKDHQNVFNRYVLDNLLHEIVWEGETAEVLDAIPSHQVFHQVAVTLTPLRYLKIVTKQFPNVIDGCLRNSMYAVNYLFQFIMQLSAGRLL